MCKEDQANVFMKTNGQWGSIQQLQRYMSNDASSKRPLTAYINSMRVQQSKRELKSQKSGPQSMRVSNVATLKEATQAMKEIKQFEK